MLEDKASCSPNIVYRPIHPSDLAVLESIHVALFPIRYELEFFLNVVNGRDIVSWGAVDRSRPGSLGDELIGFVTTRIVPASESELVDMLGCNSSRSDQILVYILTLGVVEPYRQLGIASTLVQEVIKYASSMSNCRAVYLHVIDYNDPAILFYKKMSFKLERRLMKFYYIGGQHYDSYLFVHYVNNQRSPCSPLDLLSAMVAHLGDLFATLIMKLWKGDGKKSKWRAKCKESRSLLDTESKKIHCSENAVCECV